MGTGAGGDGRVEELEIGNPGRGSQIWYYFFDIKHIYQDIVNFNLYQDLKKR